MLTIYEGKFTRLKDDRDNLIKAKEALELADPGEPFQLYMYIHTFPVHFQLRVDRTLHTDSLGGARVHIKVVDSTPLHIKV